MRYLIITKDDVPFFTEYYDYENFYNPEVMKVIFDIIKGLHTFDGKNWIETGVDHL